MLRLFVGLEIPDDVKQSLIIPRGGVESAHWQRDDQLHLTLAFIGRASPSEYGEIVEALEKVRFQPFELTLKGVDIFGTHDSPRVLFAACSQSEKIQYLHEKIMRALHDVGLELDERKFKPHVTLARFRRHQKAKVEHWITGNQNYTSPAFQVRSFTLFSSLRSRDGSYYQVEERIDGEYGLGLHDLQALNAEFS